jgi:hypothetical protein
MDNEDNDQNHTPDEPAIKSRPEPERTPRPKEDNYSQSPPERTSPPTRIERSQQPPERTPPPQQPDKKE